MTEHKMLPNKIAAQAALVPKAQRRSLVERGLMALKKDNDALYRQVRNVFGGNDGRNWNGVTRSISAPFVFSFLGGVIIWCSLTEKENAGRRCAATCRCP